MRLYNSFIRNDCCSITAIWKQRFLEAGMDDCLARPVLKEYLERVLGKYFG